VNLKGRIFSHIPPSLGNRILHSLGRLEPWNPGFDFTPPEPWEGEEAGPPDFVGIGAQNCGTRWWHDMLQLHPGVSHRAGLQDGLHFFDRFGDEPFSHSMIDGYHGWFPRRPGTLVGEWTQEYFHYPWVPQLLHEAAPHVRLLLLLRDPVERMRSTFEHHPRRRQRLPAKSLAFALDSGLYNQILEQWYEVFDVSQFLILQYEQCVVDVDRQLASTFAYLGLTEYHSPETERPRNPALLAPKETGRLDDDVKKRLVELYSHDVIALARRLPDLDLSLWPNFAHLAGR
jgi:hypothetical protein